MQIITPSERYLLSLCLSSALVLLLILTPFLLICLAPEVGWGFFIAWAVVTLALLLIAYFFARAYYASLEYLLTDDAVIVRRGVITHSEAVVPFRTVVNIDLKRGPFDRLLGLGSLQIHTAGYSQSSSAEASLVGLEDYERWHEVLQQALRETRRTLGAEAAGEEAVGGEVETAALLREIRDELIALRRELGARG